jgi:hypothetical protein
LVDGEVDDGGREGADILSLRVDCAFGQASGRLDPKLVVHPRLPHDQGGKLPIPRTPSPVTAS